MLLFILKKYKKYLQRESKPGILRCIQQPIGYNLYTTIPILLIMYNY